MSEKDVIAEKVDGLSRDVGGLRADMKELTKAMKELIRIDGDIKRLGDMVMRIGKESDDHETRLRMLEGKPGRFMERILTHFLSSLVGGFVVFFFQMGG